MIFHALALKSGGTSFRKLFALNRQYRVTRGAPPSRAEGGASVDSSVEMLLGIRTRSCPFRPTPEKNAKNAKSA